MTYRICVDDAASPFAGDHYKFSKRLKSGQLVKRVTMTVFLMVVEIPENEAPSLLLVVPTKRIELISHSLVIVIIGAPNAIKLLILAALLRIKADYLTGW